MCTHTNLTHKKSDKNKKMSYRFDVSLPKGEKKLAEWIRERMDNNDIIPSLVFRDAMIEKKKEWDSINSENTHIYKKRITELQKTIRKVTEFIEENGLSEEWVSKLNEPEKLKKSVEVETILEDNSKKLNPMEVK